MATQNLELFYKPTCPYCHKVMSFMEQNNIELPMHDIVADDAARERQGASLRLAASVRFHVCSLTARQCMSPATSSTTSPRSSTFLVQTMIQTMVPLQLLAPSAVLAPSKIVAEKSVKQ